MANTHLILGSEFLYYTIKVSSKSFKNVNIPNSRCNIVQLELGKASYVIAKLAVTFEKINIADLSQFSSSLFKNLQHVMSRSTSLNEKISRIALIEQILYFFLRRGQFLTPAFPLSKFGKIVFKRE